jgi:hypothetical protein
MNVHKPSNAAAQLPKVRVPLLVGVTGHRHIEAEQRPALLERIQQVLRELHGALPNTPLVMVNALAEGADLLVAEAALDMGWTLFAPLPMEPKRYAQSFDSPDAAARMLELIEQGMAHVVLGDAQDDQATCFIKLETYLAQHSHVLLALWDGDSAGGHGGTASVVQTARTSEVLLKEVRVDADRQEEIQKTPSIPVVWLPTLREGAEVIAAKASEKDGVALLPPQRNRQDDLGEAKLQAPKRVIAHLLRHLRPTVAWNEVLEPLEKTGVAAEGGANAWTLRLETLGGVAMRSQKATRVLYQVRLAMVATGFMALELVVGPLAGMAWVSVLGVVLMAAGTLGLARWNQRLDMRYLEARTLTEHLRIRQALPLLDGKLVAGACTRHLRLVPHSGDALCHILDSWEVVDSVRGKEALRDAPSAKESLQEWVQDQSAYFRRVAKRERASDVRYVRIAGFLLLFGLALSLGLAASFLPALKESLHPWQTHLGVIATASILSAAAFRALQVYRAFGPMANRFELACMRFEHAAHLIERALDEGDEECANRRLHALANLAYRENSEWFALQLERPPDAKI